MATKKLNHLLPRMVIKRWEENNGKIFDKEENKIRKVNKYDYSEKYYYSLGKEDDELENKISTFESYIANILKQLNEAQSSIELTKKDVEILKLYVVLQSCRNNNTSPVIKNDETGIYINNNYLFGVPLVTTQEEAVQVTTLICDEFNKIKNSNDNFNNITSQFCLGLHLVIVTNENNEFIISETTSIIECTMDSDYLFTYVPISPKLGLILAKFEYYFSDEKSIEYTKQRFGDKYGSGKPDQYLSTLLSDNKLIYNGIEINNKIKFDFVKLTKEEIYSLNSIIYEDGNKILFCNESSLEEAKNKNPVREIYIEDIFKY